jgi:hypothetical protein
MQFTFDKPRELKCDIRATKALEREASGKSLGVLLSEMRQFGVTAITQALWAGLKHEDPTLTMRRIEDLLDQYLKDRGLMVDVVDALIAAFEESGMFRTRADLEREDTDTNPKTAVM